MQHRHALLLPRSARRCVAVALVALGALPVFALAQQGEPVDSVAMLRLREEGSTRSHVMQLASMLTDRYGPRLTGSPNLEQAEMWAVETMHSWGIREARLEPWGAFGTGWVSDWMSANVVAPVAFPLIAYPEAWSPGTNGPRRGEVVIVTLRDDADFAKYAGQLRGKWVISEQTQDIAPHFRGDAHRLTTPELDSMAAYKPPLASAVAARPMLNGPSAPTSVRPVSEIAARRTRFLYTEGVLGTLNLSGGDYGDVFPRYPHTNAKDAPNDVPGVALAAEQFGRIVRLIQQGEHVTVEVEMRNRFINDHHAASNVIGEITGSDSALRNQVVMLGAHLDSWQAGTGATDNAGGSAVMLEALRILKAVGLPMKRTVRLALWTGEEQGLLGSSAYVRTHFEQVDSVGTHASAEQAQVSVYFNLDNGTGTIRGVYSQGNADVVPIFQSWMAPLADLGATTVTMRSTGGTDHLPFNRVNIPAFQFIQDPIDYMTRTHHSNMDVYERLLPSDLMRNAIIVASFVYDAANRSEMLPRH